ncbi:MAG: enoyl-CoA hydratase-related protein [Gammaproteobacteria bacterium]
MSEPIQIHVDERGAATITLNRPEVRNAFDDRLIGRLDTAVSDLGADPKIRVIVLTGAGKAFSAGADINWMRAMAACGHDENHADALRLARLMARLDAIGKPTVARVNGPAIGGGVGLVACCDIAVASTDARFGLSEVRLGLVPAVISPYVIAAVGRRNARRLFLTGELLNAKQARRAGLVHEIAKPSNLNAAVEDQIAQLLLGGPVAQREAKQLIRDITAGPFGPDAVQKHTAELIARLRVSDEGQEGLGAFLDKRKAAWVGKTR